jgi:hypothetical protein
MSAVRFNPVTLWIKVEPIDNPYWELIKNNSSFEIKPVDPVTGITLDLDDFIGKLDIIYIAPCTKQMVDDYALEHPQMYEVDGEFEAKDMCLIKVDKPELIDLEFVNGNSALANVIKHVLLERVWNVKI